MSLKKRTFSGLIWTFMDTVMTRGIGIVASILLARLLSPVEFGLMGMIYIITAVSASLVDSGLTTSLIREKNTDNVDFSTIFFTNIFIGILLYLIIYIMAPYVSMFYSEPSLIRLIRVYSLIIVINSFSQVQHVLFQKKMEFKRLMLLNIPGIIIGALIGIFAAYYDYGVWSIVFMQLATQIVLGFMIWIVSDWKPTFVFSISILNKHFNFGYKLMLSGIINSVFENIYNVLIGRYFSTLALGQFDRAKVFSQYPSIILTNMVGKVTYPLLSEIQNEKERLKNAYKTILKFIFFIAAPIMLGLSAVANPLILWLLGPQWVQAGHFFQILCLVGVLYPIQAFNLNLLKVYGRSDWVLKLEIMKKIIIVLIVFIAFQFGIEGLVWSSVLTAIISVIINSHFINKLIKYSILDQFKDISISLILSIMMFSIMYSVLYLDYFDNLILEILVPSSIGFLFYIIANYILKTEVLSLIMKFKRV